jgi:hypothetical protein
MKTDECFIQLLSLAVISQVEKEGRFLKKIKGKTVKGCPENTSSVVNVSSCFLDGGCLPEYLSFTRIIEFKFGLNLDFELRPNSRSSSLCSFPTKGPLNQINIERKKETPIMDRDPALYS